jgi:hypothetical protein
MDGALSTYNFLYSTTGVLIETYFQPRLIDTKSFGNAKTSVATVGVAFIRIGKL